MNTGPITYQFPFQVDSAFQSMMNENSLDYVAKFADLAAQISASHRKPEETL